MKHPSAYLDWYVHVPVIEHDLRSSGLASFNYDVDLGEVDLSRNYAHGNPKTVELLAQRYCVRSGNVFVSSEGASGQNARVIRCLAEKNPKKTEAIIEYPTYEPLLRQTQEHFRQVKRLVRRESQGYGLDVDALRKLASDKTGVVVLTNPHAPSSALAGSKELADVMALAHERDFYVVCDEIYAEFDRNAVPSLFSVDLERSIVTTSFTKAYGLGGLKLGTALANERLVDMFYSDVLNTVGNSPNVVQILAAEMLAKGMAELESHKKRWMPLKKETEEWLNEQNIEYFPNRLSATYWARLPVKDTYQWTDEFSIPRHSVAVVPGAFFLFKNNHKIVRSSWVRIGIGNVMPDDASMAKALKALGVALATYQTAA